MERNRRTGRGDGRLWTGRLLVCIVLMQFLVPLSAGADSAGDAVSWSGPRIMEEVVRRHDLYPYVFEQQTMVLTDHAGSRDVRKVRRFSRVASDGTVKMLLVFDYPPEVRGVAMRVVGREGGRMDSGVYLPALERMLEFRAGKRRGGNFLGTDFAVEDLAAEIIRDFRYDRKSDKQIDDTSCFVVEAIPRNPEIEQQTGYSLRRHFIRQDIFFVVRTEYHDLRGRFFKTLTRHDLKQVDGQMWRAGMMLMVDHKAHHQTLLKVNRRVFSGDYVPESIFTRQWLLENRHVRENSRRIPDSPSPDARGDNRPETFSKKRNPASSNRR